MESQAQAPVKKLKLQEDLPDEPKKYENEDAEMAVQQNGVNHADNEPEPESR